MSVIEAGKQIKTADDYIAEIYEAIGAEGMPIKMQVTSDGKLLNISVETEWKAGQTIPVEEEVEVERVILVDDMRDEEQETEIVDENGDTVKGTRIVKAPYQREETIIEKEIRVVDYKEEYTQKELTKAQIKKINEWIAENVGA